jgi:deazaflavin-dependent oxidoreductase (nitroreductase family)
MNLESPSLFERLLIKTEDIIMTQLVPLDRPGPVFKWLFRIPILFYKLGLGWVTGKYILLLTTTGRKTGKLHATPLEYHYDQERDRYFVMAGWGGRTDWYRNAVTTPQVLVQVGRRKFEGLAEPVSQEEITERLVYVVSINPKSLKLWSRWTGEELDGSRGSLARAAGKFPSLWLRPLTAHKAG